MRILLIEDEPLIACDLAAIVEELGHEVVGVAETCAEALALAEELKPQAALVDVKLRDGFTGPEIAARLRDDFAIACAYVTGNPEQVTPCAIPVVRKPFSSRDVAAALGSLR